MSGLFREMSPNDDCSWCGHMRKRHSKTGCKMLDEVNSEMAEKYGKEFITAHFCPCPGRR